MFELPYKLKIGWKDYFIYPGEEFLNSGDELYGQIDYQQDRILLRAHNTQAQSECTLIHEVLHGISDMYGIEMSEETVTRLANALYTVLCDNYCVIQRCFGVPIPDNLAVEAKS